MNEFPELDGRRSIRDGIAAWYRDRLRTGAIAPGDRLPPARRIAAALGVAEAGVHAAIRKLADEGLVCRRPRAGTTAVRRDAALRTAAVFIPWSSIRRGDEFTLRLVRCLAEALGRRGIGCRVCYDTPDGCARRGLELAAAARRVQGVIVRGPSPSDRGWLEGLGVPYYGLGVSARGHGFGLFTTELAESMAGALAARGCRTAGAFGPFDGSFQGKLARALDARGIEFREEWCRRAEPEEDSANFAWRSVEYLAGLPERPRGLMLFSDDLVYGAALAFYRYGIAVPRDCVLAIHHTVENPVIFPFPCTLVQHRIAALAASLASGLEAISRGEPYVAPPQPLRTVSAGPGTVMCGKTE